MPPGESATAATSNSMPAITPAIAQRHSRACASWRRRSATNARAIALGATGAGRRTAGRLRAARSTATIVRATKPASAKGSGALARSKVVQRSVGENGFVHVADSGFQASSNSRSRILARSRWDFSVPSGRPSTCAASACVRSRWKQCRTARRWGLQRALDVAPQAFDGARIVRGAVRGFGVGFAPFQRQPGAANVLEEAGQRYAMQPGGEPCIAAEVVQVQPGLHEGLLREIVGERRVALREPAQLQPHTRVVRAHETRERAAVAPARAGEPAGDLRLGTFRFVERHGAASHFNASLQVDRGRLRRLEPLRLELQRDQLEDADRQWNQADGP